MAGPSSPSQGSSQSADQPYFLNHFNLGIDFMMSGSTHRLLKVILHANTPGEVLFGRYEQCPWSMKFVNQEMTVQSSDPVREHLHIRPV